MQVISVFLTALGVGLFEYARCSDVKGRANNNVARSLKEIEHVVIFMQENRSWNNVSFRGLCYTRVGGRYY